MTKLTMSYGMVVYTEGGCLRGKQMEESVFMQLKVL